MFARVTRLQGTPETIEKMAAWRVPKDVQSAAGFKGSYVLLDRKSSKMMTMALWESEKAMVDSTELANRIRGQAAIDLGAVGAPVVEMYEVVSQA